MSSRNDLKQYFLTGKKPSQQEFADFIDSMAHLDDLSTAVLATLAEALAGTNNTKGMSPFLVKSVIFDKIVNDLNTGGVQKLLSAEQGKVLNDIKANKNATNLGTTEIAQWKAKLSIGNEIIRAGSRKVLSGITSASGTMGRINYATISGFNYLNHLLFARLISIPTNLPANVFTSIARTDLEIMDYKDSYLKYYGDVSSINSSYTPVDIYLYWHIIQK